MSADHDDELPDALQELDASAEEGAAWAMVLERLVEWPNRRIMPADQNRLLATLGVVMPQPSPVRATIQERLARRNPLVALLATVHSQVNVLRPSFWGLGALLILAGVIVELASPSNTVSITLLWALTPLLAYLSVASVFRSARWHTLEWELACPPSAFQLIVARLTIVLGYDVALGMILSVVGTLRGNGDFLVVTLHWLMPLLLTFGIALALSLRLPAAVAAGIAYCGWLLLLALGAERLQALFIPQLEALLSLVGVGLVVLALWRFTEEVPRHLVSPIQHIP